MIVVVIIGTISEILAIMILFMHESVLATLYVLNFCPIFRYIDDITSI